MLYTPDINMHRKKTTTEVHQFILQINSLFLLKFQNKVANPLLVLLKDSEKRHIALATFFSHQFPSPTSALMQ